MLIELVRQGAQEMPDRPVIISAAGATSYGECRERSERVARGLADRGIERFGSALDDAADNLAILVASSAVGSEACLYPPGLDSAQAAGLAARFGHEVVITSRDGVLDAGVTLDDLEHPDELSGPPAEHAPVLILTTGTTGAQQGARHDWRVLVDAAARHRDERAGNRWLLAYNPNQFAGIQILVHSLVSQATLVVPASRRIDDVLAAIRTHGVTHASGTPTFWRLVVGHLDAAKAARLELRQITLGGEAAPQGLLDQLRHLFPDARISHVFASTEAGSVVSVQDGLAGLPLSVLERGDDAPVQLRVVDGELQIRSRVGMLGYHERDDDFGEWRGTGDLVEVGPDRIRFVGRTTEIINVGGAKVHPLPVEEVVCSVEGVELAAVYGRPNPITGEIVAVDVVALTDADSAELTARIHERCRQLPAAARPRRIRIVPELDISQNKLLRHEAQRAG